MAIDNVPTKATRITILFFVSAGHRRLSCAGAANMSPVPGDPSILQEFVV
jgi:hypothetical protein